jgi:hypothetical protein
MRPRSVDGAHLSEIIRGAGDRKSVGFVDQRLRSAAVEVAACALCRFRSCRIHLFGRCCGGRGLARCRRTVALFTTRGAIEWFAEESGRIAWISSTRSPGSPRDVCAVAANSLKPLRIHVRRIASAAKNLIVLQNSFCTYDFVKPVIAFGGTRVVAEFVSAVGNTEVIVSLETASLTGAKPLKVEGVQALFKDVTGKQHGPLLVAADGPLLAAVYDCEIGDECSGAPPGASDQFGVLRVAGRRLRNLFSISSAPKLLAVGGGTVALATDSEIVIGSARGGGVHTRIAALGAKRALATSSQILAVVTRRDGVDWIDYYDAQTGAARGKVNVGRAGNTLAVSGFRVVFSSGRSIRALDTRTQKTNVITIAGATPVGLSVDGARLTWAEDLRGAARIRSVRLPGS